jgi:TatD DNase family protein
MIDCHAHLALEDFDEDRADVLERAGKAGVESMVVVGENRTDSLRVLTVCREYPDRLRPCIGLHPDRFAEDRDLPTVDDIEDICSLVRSRRPEIVGIGEVGLDFWSVKDTRRRAAQQECLARMSALANELDLPLNVHSRSSGHYALDLLAECGTKRVLMHAFDGKAGYAARAAAEHGWLFSIPPSIVRSPQKQKLAKALPLASLALESDSPALGPERGDRNEPANLLCTVQLIAELKGVDETEVREATTENAKRLFGLN